MNTVIAFFYNLYYQIIMRPIRKRLYELAKLDLTTLDTVEQTSEVLRELLDMIDRKHLSFLENTDLYNVNVTTNFIRASYLNRWLEDALKTIRLLGNADGDGYLDFKVGEGFKNHSATYKLYTWLDVPIISNDNFDIALYYVSVAKDIRRIEAAMNTVTDPYFKKYYESKLASALREYIIVIYAINQKVAFHEW